MLEAWWGSLIDFLGSAHAYWVLFLSSFTSSTILPGSSEAVLTATILSGAMDWERIALLVAVATLGNTLGGMTSWCIGRFLPEKEEWEQGARILRRWGTVALFFAWLPIVGDFLPVAAGWCRLPFWLSFWVMGIGRLLRYTIVALIAYGLI